jgi:hypothetical protein
MRRAGIGWPSAAGRRRGRPAGRPDSAGPGAWDATPGRPPSAALTSRPEALRGVPSGRPEAAGRPDPPLPAGSRARRRRTFRIAAAAAIRRRRRTRPAARGRIACAPSAHVPHRSCRRHPAPRRTRPLPGRPAAAGGPPRRSAGRGGRAAAPCLPGRRADPAGRPAAAGPVPGPGAWDDTPPAARRPPPAARRPPSAVRTPEALRGIPSGRPEAAGRPAGSHARRWRAAHAPRHPPPAAGGQGPAGRSRPNRAATARAPSRSPGRVEGGPVPPRRAQGDSDGAPTLRVRRGWAPGRVRASSAAQGGRGGLGSPARPAGSARPGGRDRTGTAPPCFRCAAPAGRVPSARAAESVRVPWNRPPPPGPAASRPRAVRVTRVRAA